MARIQILSENVIAQIAAGEVIERPASVLKELLENSIDAGATRLDVEIGQGGLEYLRVVDDGCGIEWEDLPLAFTTHATSKLRAAEDLFAIGTLGFRGEGLASVGSVAQVTLQSRPTGHDRGAEVKCNGGKLSEVRVWNGAPGTRIEVRQLFFNTPVRRKFLRGAATEMGHISEVFTRLALSQLSLHLTLKHNGRVVHEVPGSAGLLDRIALFFGEELRRKLIMVEAEQDGVTLGGYVADPAHETGGAQMQYVFINGRWVRDRLVSQAIQEAYRGLMMTNRHPIAFLFLELPPDGVDVNVHPTKSEVRFRQPEKVQALIQATIQKSLSREDLTTPLKAPAATPVVQTELVFNAPIPPVGQATRLTRPTTGETPVAPTHSDRRDARRHDTQDELALRRYEEDVAKGKPRPTTQPKPAVADRPAPPVAPIPRPLSAVQMHDLYLVVEVRDGILIIDQHALHERVLFEQLKTRLASGKMEVQKLLIPEPITLPPAQASLLLGHRAALAELGLILDDFGGGTVLLGGYPAVLGQQPPREMLAAVIAYLTKQDRPPTREAMLNDVMALMACHAAVRAGDRLTPDEIAYLVEQRQAAENSHHCPHGRPSSLMFTRAELDRQFRRT